MEPTDPTPAREVRCDCGQLLARLTPAGVELKCKRCKQIHLIPWEQVAR